MIKIFGDQVIWWVSMLLFLISVLLVYSSGGYSSIVSHIPHVIMAIGIVFIFSRFNYKYFTNLSTICLARSIVMALLLREACAKRVFRAPSISRMLVLIE